ncbi:mCG146062, partial [Mus musculus]
DLGWRSLTRCCSEGISEDRHSSSTISGTTPSAVTVSDADDTFVLAEYNPTVQRITCLQAIPRLMDIWADFDS